MAHKKPNEADLDHWRVFTRRIYNEWDADPGYYAIQHTAMPQDQRLRLAIAWCAYYNLGIAAQASELSGRQFWNYLEKIYPTAKRATERRHFRGNAGTLALLQWRERWSHPEAMVEHIVGGAPQTYFGIRSRCKSIAQYGDYFYWKWCDLHEVLGYGPLDMTGSEKYTPKLPQQGANLIYGMAEANMESWHYRKGAVHDYTPEGVLVHTYDEIIRYGRTAKVPPRTTEDRAFGLQEAETVCCVYKQMANGSYTYGTRTAKALRRLRVAQSEGCKTAGKMAATLLRLSPYSEQELNTRLDSLTK